MTADDEDEPPKNEEEDATANTSVASAATTAREVETSASYPVDLPSPILLGASIVLAIAGVGSLFELFGGSPKLGVAVSAAIAAVGLPLCLFLFYAAIQKAIAETEEDDRRFNRGL